MRKVKVGVVGLGHMGQGVHLPILLSFNECEVVALAEPRGRLLREVGRKFGIERLYRSHEEMAEDPEVEAVVVAVPDASTAEVAATLLRAGKHVMVEKPLATCLDEARKAAEAARKAGKVLMVAYPLRYDPGVRRAKGVFDELVESGELGKVISVRGVCVGDDWRAGYFETEPLIATEEAPPPSEPKLPDFLPPDLAGPYLFFNNCYCHNVNLVRYLFGDPLEVAYFEVTEGVYRLILHTPDGASVDLELGHKRPDWWDESLTIVFEKGWLEIRTPPRLLRNASAVLRLYRADRKELTEIHSPRRWAFKEEDHHFIRCILESKEPDTPADDALRDIALSEQAFRKANIVPWKKHGIMMPKNSSVRGEAR